MDTDQALLNDLVETRGLRGLASHFGPEGSLPPELPGLIEHALDTLPDEGDRLVRALAGLRPGLANRPERSDAGADPAVGPAGPVASAAPGARALPFCGRREQLETIYNAVRDAVAQRRLHIVEISGERGLGKTRVLAEALAIIDPEARGIDVLPVAARPGDGRQAILAQLVRRRFGILPRDSDQAAYDRILEALEPLFDERSLVGNARLLGHLAGLRAMGPGADALPADLEAFRRHAFKALVTVFRHDLAKAPRILVLQRPGDLGARALEALTSLVTELATEPLVLAVLAEGGMAQDVDAPPGELGATGAPHVRVQVEPLHDRDVERLVQSLFAAPEPELTRELTERARGNPRLVLENARLLVQRGELVAGPEGLVREAGRPDGTASQATAPLGPLASDLDDASRLRMAALSAAERALLQAAASFGRAFDAEAAFAVGAALEPDLAAALTSPTGEGAPPPASLHAALRRLGAVGILRPLDDHDGVAAAGAHDRPGADGWRFAHHDDRARLLADLDDGTRALMHALAAQWLEARPIGGHDPGAFYEAVAAHWLRAGRPTEAAQALGRAGEAARDGLALSRAKVLFRTALEALGLHGPARGIDRAPLVISTALAYADLALKTSDFPLARLLCASALEASHAIEPRPAAELGDVARAWLLLGRAYRGLGQYGLAKAAVAHAAEHARRAADRRGSGDALAELARVHWLEGGEGGYAEALRLFEEALELRRSLGSARAIAETLGLIANIHIQRGDYDAARAPLEEASALAREAFDVAAEARALMALGAIAYFGGDLERALEVWKDGLRAAETAGERELIGAFLNNLGETRLARGELDHAAAALLEARETTTETGDLRTLAEVLKNLSALYARRGDLGRAQATADEALALATAMHARPSLGPALRARAEVRSLRALAESSPELAQLATADFEQAIAIFASLGDRAEHERTVTALANHHRVFPR